MYSALVVNVATVDCCFELHDTAPPAIKNIYPEVDRLVSELPA